MKRLILMAGGVLVLAACDSATAPMSLYEGGQASGRAKKTVVKTVTPTNPPNTMNSLCAGGGMYAWSGPPENPQADSVWVPCGGGEQQ